MLQGQIAIVTGASRGIGAGVARELAAQGATVIAATRTKGSGPSQTWGTGGLVVPGSLDETVGSIASAGGKAEAYPIDLSQGEAIEAMMASVMKRHGRIDILANCAMGFPQSYKGELWNAPLEDWDTYMDVGLRAKYLSARFVAPHMIAQGTGLIANISAGASKDDYYNPVFRIAMAGIDRLTSAAAADLAAHSVAVVSIWPRWVRTERVMLAIEDPSLGFEVSEEDLEISDSPEFTGRAIAHLAADPKIMKRTGQTFPLVQLSHDYGFDDIDGRRPALDDNTVKWSRKLAEIDRILKSV